MAMTKAVSWCFMCTLLLMKFSFPVIMLSYRCRKYIDQNGVFLLYQLLCLRYTILVGNPQYLPPTLPKSLYYKIVPVCYKIIK